MKNGRTRELVLASGSRSRREMLAAAGLSFTVKPADVDEAAIRDALTGSQSQADPADIAEVLALAKAKHVSAQMPGALVIGADQVLAMDGRIFDKPRDMAGARRRLIEMGGKTHQLHAAVTLVEDGAILWSMIGTAQMTVRPLTPAFVGRYLERAGDKVLESVGAYQLEGLGVQLFDAIDGDYFTILGLPLLPLLAELRERGLAPA